MKKSKNDMADLFRATFRRSGLSLKRVADEAQVPYASVHGFLTGDRDPALSTTAKIAKVLGLELRPRRRRKKG